MSANPAPMILAILTAIAAAVWLFSAHQLANAPALAARRASGEALVIDSEVAAAVDAATIVGQAEVEGEAAVLSPRLASLLAKNGVWPGGPIAINRRDDDLITFTSPGAPNHPSGEVRLHPAGRTLTRIDYTVTFPGLRRFLKFGWMIQAAGLVLIAVMFWALRTFCADSPNPSLRWQCIQMVQTIHVLWPPLWLAWLYRKQYRAVQRQIDTTIQNLPYVR